MENGVSALHVQVITAYTPGRGQYYRRLFCGFCCPTKQPPIVGFFFFFFEKPARLSIDVKNLIRYIFNDV